MAECEAHTDTLRAGTPVTLGRVTLLPIERTVLHAGLVGNCPWFAASKHVYALVVRDEAGTRAIDADAQPVSLEDLRQRLPGFDDGLAPR
jgi:hypothetical protein